MTKPNIQDPSDSLHIVDGHDTEATILPEIITEQEQHIQDPSDSFHIVDSHDIKATILPGIITEQEPLETALKFLDYSKIAYNNSDDKLEKKGYKSKQILNKEGYITHEFMNKFCRYRSTYPGYLCIKDKEIIIAYRGTKDSNDMINGVNARSASATNFGTSGNVHQGFFTAWNASRDNMICILSRYVNIPNGSYKHRKGRKPEIQECKVTLTGHSLGGVCAQFTALHLLKEYGVKDIKIVTYGTPAAFDKSASKGYNDLLMEHTLTVVDNDDPIINLSSRIYYPVGKLLKVGKQRVDASVSTDQGIYTTIYKYIPPIPDLKSHTLDSYRRAIAMEIDMLQQQTCSASLQLTRQDHSNQDLFVLPTISVASAELNIPNNSDSIAAAHEVNSDGILAPQLNSISEDQYNELEEGSSAFTEILNSDNSMMNSSGGLDIIIEQNNRSELETSVKIEITLEQQTESALASVLVMRENNKLVIRENNNLISEDQQCSNDYDGSKKGYAILYNLRQNDMLAEQTIIASQPNNTSPRDSNSISKKPESELKPKPELNSDNVVLSYESEISKLDSDLKDEHEQTSTRNSTFSDNIFTTKNWHDSVKLPVVLTSALSIAALVYLNMYTAAAVAVCCCLAIIYSCSKYKPKSAFKNSLAINQHDRCTEVDV